MQKKIMMLKRKNTYFPNLNHTHSKSQNIHFHLILQPINYLLSIEKEEEEDKKEER